MRRFERHSELILERCLARGEALMLFDFDGTLAPIVGHPNRAALPARWRSRLESLAGHRGIKVGIVTGRPYQDIRKRIPTRGVVVSTDHGHEVRLGRKLLMRVGGGLKREMAALAKDARTILDKAPEAFVEEKDYSVAVHYRLVPQRKKACVVREFVRIAKPHCKKHRLTISRGKQVIEVRQSGLWDKGKASLWIWRRLAPDALPFYFGDDTTDEDAFKALGRRGITVRVGMKRGSRARYFVDEMDEVAPFFERLLKTI
ncbi:MAG: trehalose-phosphatase [Proteobacteria bacterium]|nr:trehalose-phosphatase [Pseudomonadota bacterium]